MMNRRMAGMTALIVIVAMAVVAWLTGRSLPTGLVLPTHWNAAGHADGFSGKWFALLMPVVLSLLVSALFYALPALEPRRGGLARSQGLYLWSWMALLFMFCIVQFAVVAAALGWNVDVARLITFALGLLFATIGNQLGKSRSMYMVGIRTPWTLASEEVWIKTHRLGGKLMTAAGLLTIVLAAIPLASELRLALVLALVLSASLYPAFYSYRLWQREQASQSSE